MGSDHHPLPKYRKNTAQLTDGDQLHKTVSSSMKGLLLATELALRRRLLLPPEQVAVVCESVGHCI